VTRTVRTKKILHVISSASVGGAESCYLEMVSGCIRLGYDVYAVCMPGGDLAGMTRELFGAGREKKVFEIAMRDNADILALWRLYKHIRELKPDLCHLHMNRATLLGALASRFCGTASIGTIQGEVRPLYASFPDHLTFCSRNVADFVRSRSATVAAKSSFFLYNKIDTGKISALAAGGGREFLKSEFGIPENAFVLCEVARLHPNKGQRFFIDAVARNISNIPNIYGIVVGGEDGGYLAGLKKQAEKLGIAERIIFAGTRHDVPKILKGSDLFVLPSLQEGIPVTIMESLAIGLPVLAFDVGGISELCVTQSGREDFIEFAPRGDALALNEKVGRIFRDYDKYKKAARKAEVHIKADFDAASYMRDVDAIYRHIFSGRK